ncbi:MAG: type II secretion system minor pseudopilin GspI [Woeseiaceae bacterium]|nr:type II secretion system minor pseudopilin GspI [Woeseiaceae bacterium]NIP20368.1 type II secretion system minor pseudopilin GspI [Woeseiaceae bacterium]NIS89258.1 type II secretion system minor pseudopilin GspI [Woeseiaceae bacterium]
MGIRRNRAFTLVEVMVALAIIALSLTAVGAKMARMIDTSNSMQERTYASWIAQNKITEMRLANVLPEVTTTSGDIDYANRTWRWRAVVAETGIENLFRVDVEITSTDSNTVIRKVTGFIGEPVIPGQSNRSWNRGSENAGVTQ